MMAEQARDTSAGAVIDLSPLQGASIIAINLEGTLISDAITCTPRPGLRRLIEVCIFAADEVVILTTTGTDETRRVLYGLGAKGLLPPGFPSVVRIVEPGTKRTDLSLVGDPATVAIIDDRDIAVPGQESRLIRIPQFEVEDDDVLSRLANAIRAKLPQVSL